MYNVVTQQSSNRTTESIAVRVKYKSTKPRSTRKQITVREKGTGPAFVMTLRVCVDNSILSTYSFLGIGFKNQYLSRSFLSLISPVSFMRISFLIK